MQVVQNTYSTQKKPSKQVQAILCNLLGFDAAPRAVQSYINQDRAKDCFMHYSTVYEAKTGRTGQAESLERTGWTARWMGCAGGRVGFADEVLHSPGPVTLIKSS